MLTETLASAVGTTMGVECSSTSVRVTKAITWVFEKGVSVVFGVVGVFGVVWLLSNYTCS